MKKLILSMLVISFMCAACQKNDSSLKKETAKYIGNLTPDQITLSDVVRGMNNVDWKAATPNGNYRCSADDKFQRVICAKE